MSSEKDPSQNNDPENAPDLRTNQTVSGSANSVYAEEDGAGAGPRDPNLKPKPREEGQALIRNNPEFEREMAETISEFKTRAEAEDVAIPKTSSSERHT